MSKKNSFFNEDNQFEWSAAVGWAVFTLIFMSIGGLDFWTTLIVMVVLIFITLGAFFWIIIMAGAITIGAMGLCYFILKKLFGVLSLKILMGVFGILVTLLVVGMLFVPDSKKTEQTSAQSAPDIHNSSTVDANNTPPKSPQWFTDSWYTTAWDWVQLPGKVIELKSMGITNCRVGYYSYECIASDKTFLDVPVSTVKIDLIGAGYLDYSARSKTNYGQKSFDPNTPLEDLGYTSIEMKFEPNKINEKCFKAAQTEASKQGKTLSEYNPWDVPRACLQNKGYFYFLQNLKAQEWLIKQERETEFYHSKANIVIRTNRNPEHSVTLSFVDNQTRDQVINRIREEEKQSQQTKKHAQQVLDAIKQ